MHKHLFIISAILFIIFSAGSCKKEGLKTYSTTNSIYFDNRNLSDYLVDSNYITYAFSPDEQADSVIRIALRVTGSPTEKERLFTIVADDSSTAIAGVHYESFNEDFMFPANKVTDTIAIKLLRVADLKERSVTLFISLKPTESFSTNLAHIPPSDIDSNGSYLNYKIEMADMLVEPRGWGDAGKFTKKKMDIICELAEISPLWFVNGDEQMPYPSQLFFVKRAYFGGLFKSYLLRNEIAGTPIYYEDGTLMRADD